MKNKIKKTEMPKEMPMLSFEEAMRKIANTPKEDVEKAINQVKKRKRRD